MKICDEIQDFCDRLGSKRSELNKGPLGSV